MASLAEDTHHDSIKDDGESHSFAGKPNPSNLSMSSWNGWSASQGLQMGVESFTRGLKGIGIRVESDQNSRHVVKEIFANGSTARDKKIEVGDAITHIDGEACR
eukprot:768759-Hanusia_phi.AAC.25